MNKIVTKEYYVEFVNNQYDSPYIMQSKTFKRPSSALNWLKNNFDYIDSNADAIEIYIMVMNWISEDEYEIEEYCRVVDGDMYFYPKGN